MSLAAGFRTRGPVVDRKKSVALIAFCRPSLIHVVDGATDGGGEGGVGARRQEGRPLVLSECSVAVAVRVRQ